MKELDMAYFGGIETGGTKVICSVGENPEHIVSDVNFPTTDPQETIQKVIDFFKPFYEHGELASIGIASFGPVDLNLDSETYGYITTTPKPGWQYVDLLGEIQRAINVPIAFDTDVNAAAIGEQSWVPENRSLNPFLYMTVGTGIGAGVISNGVPLHGLLHTEIGHIPIPHDWEKDPFPGFCPYHGDCLEGLASGPSMNKRWGVQPEMLSDSHIGWELEADYIALALLISIYTYSPQRIVLGGGISKHRGFHQSVRERVLKMNNGYIQSSVLLENIDDYIIAPKLGNRSGVLGAIAMAKNLMENIEHLPTL